MNTLVQVAKNLLIVALSAIALPMGIASAEPKDQTLVIDIDPITSCALTVTLNDPKENNCNKLEKNPCKNIKDCVCTVKDKKIIWEADSKYKYSLHFQPVTDATDLPPNPEGKSLPLTPFKEKDKNDDCSSTIISSSEGVIDCKVKNKGVWDYVVKVEGCTEGFDPRVVVQ